MSEPREELELLLKRNVIFYEEPFHKLKLREYLVFVKFAPGFEAATITAVREDYPDAVILNEQDWPERLVLYGKRKPQ